MNKVDPRRPLSLTDIPYSSWANVNRRIATLPNNYGVKFDKIGYDLFSQTFGIDRLYKLSEDETVCHAVCFASRPTAQVFYNYLEQTYFTPDTPANNQYEYRLFRWSGMFYSICTVPVEKKLLFFESAEVAKLKVQDGAVPFACGMIRGSLNPQKPLGRLGEIGTFFWFPLCNSAVSTLEGKSGDPCYNGPAGRQDAQAEANFMLKQVLEAKGLPWEDYLSRQEV
jgi:hypothetical protein